MDAETAHNIKYDLIPQECSNLPAALKRAGFPIDNILAEIISDENLSECFDYVISHLETKQQREKYYSKQDPAKGERDKRQLLSRLKKELQEGTFRIRWKRRARLTPSGTRDLTPSGKIRLTL